MDSFAKSSADENIPLEMRLRCAKTWAELNARATETFTTLVELVQPPSFDDDDEEELTEAEIEAALVE